MNVVFFGASDPAYPRNVVLREALASVGAQSAIVAVSPQAGGLSRTAGLLSRWFARGPGAFPKDVWPRITLNLRELLAAPAGKVMTFSMTPLAISSTAIRALAAEGASIRYLTPDPVVEYIRSHRLYAGAPEAGTRQAEDGPIP